eukprot:m.24392 g.24392  ORF g.24392 m.24392 type:complete len:54 (-) comp7477_c0_seq1:234-395(-)
MPSEAKQPFSSCGPLALGVQPGHLPSWLQTYGETLYGPHAGHIDVFLNQFSAA